MKTLHVKKSVALCLMALWPALQALAQAPVELAQSVLYHNATLLNPATEQ